MLTSTSKAAFPSRFVGMPQHGTSSDVAAGTTSDALVYRAPAQVTVVRGLSVFLAGSIEGSKDGTPPPWQVRLTEQLAHLPVTIFDPRRDDWDDTWEERKTDPRFAEQTNWELDQQERADIVVVHFVPGTEAAVSLLEFGLAARKGTALVCCPEAYKRRGNIEIVCERIGVPMVETLDELVTKVKERIR